MKALCYHENKKRGSQEFPLDYHYVDNNHPRYEMPYHWHEEAEIVHVISGCFDLMLDGEHCRLNEGDVAYVASGRLHGGEPQDCIYECVVFDMRLLLKMSASARSFIHDVSIRKADIESYFAFGSKIIEHTLLPMFGALREQAEGMELIVSGALMMFLGEAKRYHTYSFSDKPQDREAHHVLQLKKVFDMIESRPSNPPKLSELASSVGMSPKYFCRFFKEATHYTPVDYIGFYRIEQACYQMVATEKNVTEIALDLGYSDLNYFIRCFKKYKHIPPGQYMKALRHEGG